MGQLNLIFGWIYFHAAKPTAWFYTMDVTRLSTVDGPLHARLHVKTSLAFHSNHMAQHSPAQACAIRAAIPSARE